MKIYVSGKITGIDWDVAYEKFEKAEYKAISTLGGIEKLINPMKLHPKEPKRSWEHYMAVDVCELLCCNAIYMMSCWGSSKGARVEYAIAKELGMQIFFE